MWIYFVQTQYKDQQEAKQRSFTELDSDRPARDAAMPKVVAGSGW
jgi:hypothetical protein